MMNFILYPYLGANLLRFGMSRSSIRELLKSRVREFKKTSFDKMTTDAFDEIGVYVYYTLHDTCEAIEFALPATPIFEGESLLGKSFEQVKTFLMQRDSFLTIESSGLTSCQLGLGVYAPYADEAPDEPVEGVIIFQKGYYDNI